MKERLKKAKVFLKPIFDIMARKITIALISLYIAFNSGISSISFECASNLAAKSTGLLKTLPYIMEFVSPFIFAIVIYVIFKLIAYYSQKLLNYEIESCKKIFNFSEKNNKNKHYSNKRSYNYKYYKKFPIWA